MVSLTPFLRLALLLASRNCKVTFICTQSAKISSFLTSHPEMHHLEFQIIPYNSTANDDPFMTQIKAINSSLHQLPHILCSPHPFSSIISDFTVAAGLAPIATDLHIPHYIVSTTSARFYSTVAYLPALVSKLSSICRTGGDVNIPGLDPLPQSSIPPTWLDGHPLMNSLLSAYLLPNAQALPQVKGVILNTFDWFEPATIAALNNGCSQSNLPPVFPVGPLELAQLIKRHADPWLDDKSPESVVYVNFGSRELMSPDQVRELANGLVKSGCTFLWILNAYGEGKDENEDFGELLGDSFPERTNSKGRIERGWVNQEEVLAHPAIGGFVNQCEWDSVMDAAWHGIPILAWPQHGDQKINAEVVEKAGLGIWVKDWGWGGEKLVKAEEIGKMVSQMMGDLTLRYKAKKVQAEARKAQEGGSSEKTLMELVVLLKN